MRFEFRLPDVGEGITEAELLAWRTEAGATVREDQPLCEIETDKAVVEIPAPCSGVVQALLAEPGSTLGVGTPIAVFETEQAPRQQFSGEKHGQAAPAPASDTATARVTASAAAPAPASGPVRATPGTRRFARERGVDIASVTGSGPKGRVLRDDIEAAAPAAAIPAAMECGTARVTTPPETGTREHRYRLKGPRKAMADNMARAALIPQASTGFRARANDLVALRERLKHKCSTRISYTALVVKALVPALQSHPLLNASYDETTGEVTEKYRYDIGIAVDTEHGLMVPVLRDVDRKGLIELAAELGEISGRARERRLKPDEMRGGCFTISSLGGIGGTAFTPIVNWPEVAILGASRASMQPQWDGQQFVPRLMLPLSLSYDHRVIDGAAAARFTSHLARLLGDLRTLLL